MNGSRLRWEFLRLLTEDSETKDRRRREYNQAIFNAEGGWTVFNGTDLDMVMQKFDKAVRSVAVKEASDVPHQPTVPLAAERSEADGTYTVAHTPPFDTVDKGDRP